jgi:hypothetical protein
VLGYPVKTRSIEKQEIRIMAHDLYVENGVFACASTQAEWHAKETGHAVVVDGDIDGMKLGACMDRQGRFV